MILAPSLSQTHNILGLKSVYTSRWRLQPSFILWIPCILMWILLDTIGKEDNKNKKAQGFQISHFKLVGINIVCMHTQQWKG